jgi:transcriptional regulator with XRE-family HTH domain
VTGGGDRPAEDGAAAAFGRWLLQERELRGLERDEVARLTKLAPAVIEALESGDPDRMPPKAYVFGYLRTYAGAVGLDADDVVLRWQEVVGPEDPPASARRRPRAAIAIAIAAALVAALAAYALVAPSQQRAPPQPPHRAAAERAPYPSEPPPGR